MARFYGKDSAADVAIVGTDEVVRAFLEPQIFLTNSVHGGDARLDGD